MEEDVGARLRVSIPGNDLVPAASMGPGQIAIVGEPSCLFGKVLMKTYTEYVELEQPMRTHRVAPPWRVRVLTPRTKITIEVL